LASPVGVPSLSHWKTGPHNHLRNRVPIPFDPHLASREAMEGQPTEQSVENISHSKNLRAQICAKLNAIFHVILVFHAPPDHLSKIYLRDWVKSPA
jgi:hypothetical protein